MTSVYLESDVSRVIDSSTLLVLFAARLFRLAAGW